MTKGTKERISKQFIISRQGISHSIFEKQIQILKKSDILNLIRR